MQTAVKMDCSYLAYVPTFLLDWPDVKEEKVYNKNGLGLVSHKDVSPSYPMMTPTPHQDLLTTKFKPVDVDMQKLVINLDSDDSDEVEIQAEVIEPKRLFQTQSKLEVESQVHLWESS